MVEDAEKSMAFYRDVLGLPADPLPELPMPDGSVMHRLNAGTSVIKVRQHAEPPPAKAAPGMTRDALHTWVHIIVHSDDTLCQCAV
jgi:hypothetical protein